MVQGINVHVLIANVGLLVIVQTVQGLKKHLTFVLLLLVLALLHSLSVILLVPNVPLSKTREMFSMKALG